MICFYCKKEIEKLMNKEGKMVTDVKFISLDRPYLNIPFHTKCYDNVLGNEIEYLEQNKEQIMIMGKVPMNASKSEKGTKRKGGFHG
jgi:hypothetical protein